MSGRSGQYTGDIPREGEYRWARLYGIARHVRIGPSDTRLVRELGVTISAMDVHTGVWRNFAPQELKKSRHELPDDERPEQR